MWFTADDDAEGTGADIFYVVSTWDEELIQSRTRLSMEDVCEAFDTFIARRDNSRPLVIAGFKGLE